MTAPTAVPGALSRNNIGRGNAQWVKLAPSPEPARFLGPSRTAYDWLEKTPPPPDIDYFAWKLNPVEGVEQLPFVEQGESRIALDLLIFPSPIPWKLVSKAPTVEPRIAVKKSSVALDLLLFPSPIPPTLVARAAAAPPSIELRKSKAAYDWLFDVTLPLPPQQLVARGVSQRLREIKPSVVEYDWLLDVPAPPAVELFNLVMRAPIQTAPFGIGASRSAYNFLLDQPTPSGAPEGEIIIRSRRRRSR